MTRESTGACILSEPNLCPCSLSLDTYPQELRQELESPELCPPPLSPRAAEGRVPLSHMHSRPLSEQAPYLPCYPQCNAAGYRKRKKLSQSAKSAWKKMKLRFGEIMLLGISRYFQGSQPQRIVTQEERK